MIYIITWCYSDYSAFGVVRAYNSKQMAEADLEILKCYGDRTFAIVETQIVEKVSP